MKSISALHYSDFAALRNRPGRAEMAARLDLLERVRVHKSKFFGSSWASYETAVPGTLRLTAPEARLAEFCACFAGLAFSSGSRQCAHNVRRLSKHWRRR